MREAISEEAKKPGNPSLDAGSLCSLQQVASKQQVKRLHALLESSPANLTNTINVLLPTCSPPQGSWPC